jgi:hypothetical protein
MKRKDSIPSFRDWFANTASRKDREVMMEQTGTPLEIRSRRRLERLGFTARRRYYRDDDNTSHELDIFAYKMLEEVPLPYSFSVKFSLYLLGECNENYGYEICYAACLGEADLVPWENPSFECVGVDAYVMPVIGWTEGDACQASNVAEREVRTHGYDNHSLLT